MNKQVTVDRELLERALYASENHCGNYKLTNAEGAAQDAVRDELRAAIAAQPEQAEPLTQQQVVDGFCSTPHNVQYVAVFDAGVRFAERSHGIGTLK